MFSYLSLSLPLLTLRWVILIEPVLGTFSIVGVDTRTKEVGSAGATCITTNGFQLNMMTAVIPNNGAINVQSRHDKSAKAQAMQLFRNGETAASVMSKLPRKTQQSFSNIFQTVDQHQYLAVDINGGSATHSGPSVNKVIEAVEGNVNSRFFFAIAGNILDGTLGVTQRMKTAFENAPDSASLADRLMAAMEAGNMVGADSRCHRHGRAATTAFLQVARPTDNEDKLWADFAVPAMNKDPIAAVSLLYKQWKQRNPTTTTTTSTTPTPTPTPTPTHTPTSTPTPTPTTKPSSTSEHETSTKTPTTATDVTVTTTTASTSAVPTITASMTQGPSTTNIIIFSAVAVLALIAIIMFVVCYRKRLARKPDMRKIPYGSPTSSLDRGRAKRSTRKKRHRHRRQAHGVE
eukprot:GEMP01018099.1.p1 GENE.GEMP01018099.1~~GEMP01018099.1.p1  ORF type:complete len:404 (-),score=54.50 GEMP01018099.1:1347-2558(-)